MSSDARPTLEQNSSAVAFAANKLLTLFLLLLPLFLQSDLIDKLCFFHSFVPSLTQKGGEGYKVDFFFQSRMCVNQSKGGTNQQLGHDKRDKKKTQIETIAGARHTEQMKVDPSTKKEDKIKRQE